MDRWLILSIQCIILLTIYIIILKRFMISSGHSNYTITFNILIYFIIFCIIIAKKDNIVYNRLFNKQTLGPSIIIGGLFIIFILLQVSLVDKLSNPGYAQLIIFSNVITVTILSHFLFGSHLNKRTVLAIFIILFGMGMVITNS